jgi:hypothetical protein
MQAARIKGHNVADPLCSCGTFGEGPRKVFLAPSSSEYEIPMKCEILTNDGVLHTCFGKDDRELANAGTNLIVDLLTRGIKLATVQLEENAGLWFYLVDFYQDVYRLRSESRSVDTLLKRL